MANGSQHGMYYIAEEVYGQTPNSGELKVARLTGTTLGLSKESLQSEEIRPDRQIADFRHGAYAVGGDINAELSYGTYDDFLEAVFMGTWTSDVLKAGTTRRSFTVIRHFGDVQSSNNPYHIFTGVEMNSWSLAVSANAMLTTTFGVVGSGMETRSALPSGLTQGTASTTTPLDSFTGSLKEGNQVNAVVTEIQLQLENGIEPRYVVGSKQSIQPSVGRSNVTGTVTCYFEDSTMIDKFINETESSIEFELPDTQGNKYTVLLPRVKYSGGQPDVDGEGPVLLSMPFQALLHPTEGTNIKITRTAG